MRDKCKDSVRRAAGRDVSEEELRNIEDTIKRARREALSGQNRMDFTEETALMKAADIAANELEAEAKLKQYREMRDIIVNNAIDKTFSRLTSEGMGGIEAIGVMTTRHYGDRAKLQSLETRVKANQDMYGSRMVKMLETLAPKWWGMMTHTDGIRAFVHELYGEDFSYIVKDSKIAAEIKNAAKVWKNNAEAMRRDFNKFGGKIAFLDDWHVPQHDSIYRVRGELDKNGRVTDAARDNWVTKTAPRLKRERYTNADGTPMSDEAFKTMLENIWLTKVTDGALKNEPGTFRGTGKRSNAHSQSRVLHFKDAKSWLENQADFGGQDLFGVLVGHTHTLARDIALLESLGSNPHAMQRYWLDKAAQYDLKNRVPQEKVAAARAEEEKRYDLVSGRVAPPANEKVARVFEAYRNWITASSLGRVLLSSFPDIATMHLTAHYMGMSHMKLLRLQLKGLRNVLPGKRMDDKEYVSRLRANSLALDVFHSGMNRWGQEAFFTSFSEKMANITMRTSAIQAVTDHRRAAFGALMMGHLGMHTRKYATLAEMGEHDRNLLESKGVTEEIWNIWRRTKLEDWGGGNDSMLSVTAINAMDFTPEEKRKAILTLLGAMREEMDMAIIMPGIRERALKVMGSADGVRGELMKSIFIFKGFPISLLYKHYQRAFKSADMTPVNRAAYVGAFLAGSTLLGGVGVQIADVMDGQDPEDMTEFSMKSFWARAVAKGGGLGIYADFIFQAASPTGGTVADVLAGPLFGNISQLLRLTAGNLPAYLDNKDTHFKPELIRFLQQNTPLQNLVWTKAATDRLVFSYLQDMMEPGYTQRLQRKVEQSYGRKYYWDMGRYGNWGSLPQRAPDFGRAVGQ